MRAEEGSSGEWPGGVGYAFWFATCNALSFQMVLGSPMILFAKSLDAGATVLGIIAGMMPLLVVFQIPAARHVERIGHKRFVLSGWGIRVVFIALMCFVPWSGAFLPKGTQLGLLLFLLFGFNLSRGISSCAWLPWITGLIPAEKRGRFLAREAFCVNGASFLAFWVAAGCLGWLEGPVRYSLLFAFSALAGFVSLLFLRRLPDAPRMEVAGSSAEPVPWRAIARYEPFRRLLRFNVMWSLAFGGVGIFTVAWLKMEAGLSEGTILVVTSAAFIGGLSSLWFLGAGMDRFGSKLVLCMAMAAWVLIGVGWLFLASSGREPSLLVILVLHLLMGLGAALVNMANTRLAMGVVPEMGRPHFFAMFSVVGSVSLGISPIAWGLVIDGARAWGGGEWVGLDWNRFSVFFAGASLCFVAAFWFAAVLNEGRSIELEAILQRLRRVTLQRVWWRIWPR